MYSTTDTTRSLLRPNRQEDDNSAYYEDNKSDTDYDNDGDDEVYSMRKMAFPRTITDPLANAVDFITDGHGEVAKNIIANYEKYDDEGPEGDIPEQPAFASDMVFWKLVCLGSILGVFVGFVALAFVNVIDEVCDD